MSLQLKVTASLICVNPLGVPVSSSAQVRWFQYGDRLSVLAELQAGPELLKAEFNGGRTDQPIVRWEFASRLQHQVKALLKRGISSSIQAKAHYQVPVYFSLLLGISISLMDAHVITVFFVYLPFVS